MGYSKRFVFCSLMIFGGFIILFVAHLHINEYPFKLEGSSWLPLLNNKSIEVEVDMLDVYDLSADSDEKFKCILLKTSPPVHFCLHSLNKDIYISKSLEETVIWDPFHTNLITKILDMDKKSVLVDIGANIGYFSLLAAKSGHSVVAMEPYLENVKRMHMAAKLSKIDNRILLLNNAVAERRSEGFLMLSGNNQGDGRLEMKAKSCSGESCPKKIRTILLNDIASFFPDRRQILTGQRRNINSISKKYEKYLPLFVNMSNVVIKMDMQGFEHRIFLEADKFFDRVPVSYIVMEWELQKQYANYSDTNIAKKAKETKNFPRVAIPTNSPPDAKLLKNDFNNGSLKSSIDFQIIEKMISFLLERGFFPYGSNPEGNGFPLDPRIWGYWPYDIMWTRLPHIDAGLKFP